MNIYLLDADKESPATELDETERDDPEFLAALAELALVDSPIVEFGDFGEQDHGHDDNEVNDA